MSLKELHQEFRWLQELVEKDELTPEDISSIGERIDELKDLQAGKVDNWVQFLSVLKDRQSFVSKAIKEFQQCEKRLETIERTAKEYLVHLHEHQDLPEKLEGNLYLLRFQSSPLAVCSTEDLDLEQVIEAFPEFVQETRSLSLKKDAIKEAFVAKKPLPDGIWLEDRKHVRTALRSS
jgi:hypothetical protein